MPRLLKRYGSRKLYDTQQSRYVSLEEVAGFVRTGQQVQVLDNRTGEDVTAAILTQIVSEEGRRGTGFLSTGFLHDLIRIGEKTLRAGEEAVSAAVSSAVDAVERSGAGGLVQRSFDRLRPGGSLGEVREEMTRLRERLEALEASLRDLDTPDEGTPSESNEPDSPLPNPPNNPNP